MGAIRTWYPRSWTGSWPPSPGRLATVQPAHQPARSPWAAQTGGRCARPDIGLGDILNGDCLLRISSVFNKSRSGVGRKKWTPTFLESSYMGAPVCHKPQSMTARRLKACGHIHGLVSRCQVFSSSDKTIDHVYAFGLRLAFGRSLPMESARQRLQYIHNRCMARWLPRFCCR